MKRSLLIAVLCLLALPAMAVSRLQGWCQQGGASVTVPGTSGSGTQTFQRSFPLCTVTVYISGTATLATLYADSNGTPLANPFTASVTGFWFFYTADGHYDVRFSGGGIATPFTLGDMVVGLGELIPVTAYGAVCNDGAAHNPAAHNDHAAFVAALAANHHKTIVVPAGKACYVGTALDLSQNVSPSDNADGTVLMGYGGPRGSNNITSQLTQSTLYFDANDGLTMSGVGNQVIGLAIRGTGTGAGNGIRVRQNDAVVLGVQVSGFQYGLNASASGGCNVACADTMYVGYSDFSHNSLDGLRTEGDDSSSVKLVRLSAYENGRFGFFINAFLGASYDTLLTTGNGVAGFGGTNNNGTNVLIAPYCEGSDAGFATQVFPESWGVVIGGDCSYMGGLLVGGNGLVRIGGIEFRALGDQAAFWGFRAGKTTDQDQKLQFQDHNGAAQWTWDVLASGTTAMCEGAGGIGCSAGGVAYAFLFHDKGTGQTILKPTSAGSALYCYNATINLCDFAGAGSPEGAQGALVGSTWRRTDGGAGTSFYVKESGTGATGWVAK